MLTDFTILFIAKVESEFLAESSQFKSSCLCLISSKIYLYSGNNFVRLGLTFFAIADVSFLKIKDKNWTLFDFEQQLITVECKIKWMESGNE